MTREQIIKMLKELVEEIDYKELVEEIDYDIYKEMFEYGEIECERLIEIVEKHNEQE